MKTDLDVKYGKRSTSENEPGPIETPYDDFKRFLMKIGVSDEEANIYLTLLKHGSMKPAEIAETLDIERGRCYKILAKLESNALIEIVETSPLKYDIAPIDSIVSDHLGKVRKYVSDLEREAPNVIHKYEKLSVSRQTESMSSMPGKFKFSFVEGLKRGVEVATNIVTEARKSIYLSIDSTMIFPVKGRGLISALNSKGKEGIPIRIITNCNVKTDEVDPDLVNFVTIKTVDLPSVPNFIVVDGFYVFTIIELDDNRAPHVSPKKIKGFTISSDIFGRDLDLFFSYLWEKTK